MGVHMTTKIRLLDENVINRIAAGESVSRPAAIMKELLENALDAGSTRIDMSISAGGKSLILVQDNGEGMSEDDLRLCIVRHATSKITSFEDLSEALSYGFRGEALASIAAVSKLSIISGHAKRGHELKIKNQSVDVVPAAFIQGTRVKVEDLFKDVPARLKFLRSDRAETLAILAVVKAAALSRPDVYFHLSEHVNQDSKTLFVAPAEKESERVKRVMGDGFYKTSVEVSSTTGNIEAHGFVATSSGFRTVIGDYYVLINGRSVRAPEITAGVRSAFGDRLPRDRHAPFVLYLTLPLHDVDVNVHPAKSEVRFKDPNQVTAAIEQAVTKALSSLSTQAQIKPSQPVVRLDVPKDEGAFFVLGDWEVFEADGEVFAIDRMKIMKTLLMKSGSQDLVAPIFLPKIRELSEKEKTEAAGLGFVVSEFGGGSHVLMSVPTGVQSDPATFAHHVSKDKTLSEAALSWAMTGFNERSLRVFARAEAKRVPIEAFNKMMKKGF